MFIPARAAHSHPCAAFASSDSTTDIYRRQRATDPSQSVIPQGFPKRLDTPMLRRTRRIIEYDFRWSRKRSMQTTMTSKMIHPLLSAEGRVRLRTVEYFGWLI